MDMDMNMHMDMDVDMDMDMEMCPALGYNRQFLNKLTDVLDEMHRRLIFTVNYKGQFQKWQL